MSELQLDDDGITLDDDATVATADVGVGGFQPPVHNQGKRKESFSGATTFGILSILACLMFIAVIVLQVMEMLHLNGTFPESTSIWPPK